MKSVLRTALLASASALMLSTAAHAVEVGLNATDVIGGEADKTFQVIDDSGAKWVRIFVPADQFYDFPPNKMAALRKAVDHLHSKGKKALFVLTNSPLAWAGSPKQLPRDLNDFASWTGQMAKLGPDAVEIWNEQDAPLWLEGAPDNVDQYVAMLKLTYGKIKSVNSGITVMPGGLTGNNADYLDKMYQQGAGPYMDAIAVHTDTACNLLDADYFRIEQNGKPSQYHFMSYYGLIPVMQQYGAVKPIWMTEYGKSTSSQLCDQGIWQGQKSGGVSEAAQARFVSQAAKCLDTDHDFSTVVHGTSAQTPVQVAMWFSLRDLSNSGSPFDSFGLMHSDWSEKPAYKAFVDYAKRHDYHGEQCRPDLTGADIAINAPQDGVRFAGALRIDVGADDAIKIELYCDGKRIRNFNTDHGSIMWQGAKQLALGSHTLKVVAFDSTRNQTTKSITINKVTLAQLAAVKTKTKVIVKKLGGRKVRVAVNIDPAKPQDFRTLGKGQVIFQKYDKKKGRWVTAKKFLKNASKPFKISTSLPQGPKWRVQVVYKAKKPFKASKTGFVPIF